MHALTYGQVLCLFEGMGDYIKLTNPWGGGDDKKSDRALPPADRPTREISKDEFGTAELLLSNHRQIVMPNVMKKNISDLPADEQRQIRALIDGTPFNG